MQRITWMNLLVPVLVLLIGFALATLWVDRGHRFSPALLQKIEKRMTNAEVEAILGKPPARLIDSGCGLGNSSQLCVWAFPAEGAYVTVDFDQGDKVQFVTCRKLTAEQRPLWNLPAKTAAQRLEDFVRNHLGGQEQYRTAKPYIVVFPD
jgi:hypothetical protein